MPVSANFSGFVQVRPSSVEREKYIGATSSPVLPYQAVRRNQTIDPSGMNSMSLSLNPPLR